MTNIVDFNNPVIGFRETVKEGKLPSVTFIDPSFGDLLRGNDDAPPSDLANGQAFIASILHSLFGYENPFWDRTMLILVYDEHGGFYDHVDPPDNGVPLLGQYSSKLGPRVPAFVVSALTPKRVLHDVFDHSTIAATILRRFCSPHPPFMSPRVSAARDLREAVSLNRTAHIRDLFDPIQTDPGPNLARLESEALGTDDFHSLMNAVSLIVGGTQ
jgi:phospholipase C